MLEELNHAPGPLQTVTVGRVGLIIQQNDTEFRIIVADAGRCWARRVVFPGQLRDGSIQLDPCDSQEKHTSLRDFKCFKRIKYENI